ncbi:HAD family hydrolase [Rossellomorea vietnamensis]|uniref:HAD family hydrolase n=1 Tax=Rossellomorea vietnamensis TaxID=218284 RepID=A0A5D4NFD1_9BACI|nr:HAD family hydrolase [Rossellomorea vietnamensis]TYS12985.1 HAD family hydrolase [Rossellomorea vietnamensis]
MLGGLIFDLDQTLVDTSALNNYRSNRDWSACYKSMDQTNLFDNTKEILGFASNKGLKIGVVTMSPRPYALKLLEHHQIPFDNLVAFHDCKRRKPNPEPIIKCLKSLGLNPVNVLSIGDDRMDITASRNANISSVGVTWGNCSVRELTEAGADFIVHSNAELMKIIESY